MNILITGSSGLIGSEAVLYFEAQGNRVLGIDNNMRAQFFGPKGDTIWNRKRLLASTKCFEYFDIDICNRQAILEFFKSHKLDVVIHCAAQPSHDLAASIPFVDFDVNAVGTMNLLEATRQYAKEAPFIFMSTNKVYGDTPNTLPLVEMEKRWDYERLEDYEGIDETCRIDQSLHSLFGASKAAADLIAQEYGRYFGMNVGIFRGGCLTGPAHSGVELHGFLSYLVKVAVAGEEYTILGYNGKQVRDQIHSYDVVRAMEEFASNPRPGEVYNIGGGRSNSVSILEAIAMIEDMIGKPVRHIYDDRHRIGDHICYISNLRKFQTHYPNWSVTVSLDHIISEMVKAEVGRQTE
ncbi:MAG: NAD-dependent epimerase/dehydratase family protein [Candidatus Scalindua sp.]